MGKNSANSLAKQMQQIAANAQIEVQRLANEATQKSFDYNAKEANTARTWQKEMSDTAHQREVADLKKAGLNPVLAANQGAQSYTTSSASAQANDASSSVAGLAGNLIQSRTGAYQADVSAKATRAAAAQTAAATRYAASQAASAQRYAAAMAYQNNRMHEQWQDNYVKKAADEQIRIANNIPAKTMGSFLDKVANQAGLYGMLNTKAVKSTVSTMTKFLDNAPKYFKNSGKVTASNFVLSKAGKSLVNMQLARFGLSLNKQNQLAFVKATLFGIPKWQRYIMTNAYISKKNRSTLR